MRRPFTIALVVLGALALVASSFGMAGAHRGSDHLERPVHVEARVAYLDGAVRGLFGDRGEITAVDATSVTILRPDEVSVTLALTERTCIRVGGRSTTWEALTVGENAAAISEFDDAGVQTALVVRSGHPWFKPDRPHCNVFEGAYHADGTATFEDGTTKDYAWDRGRISGLSPHRIRIERLDGESVTAQVNRQTIVVGARSYRALNLGEPVWMISEKVGGDPEQLLAKIIRRIRS